MTDLEAFIRWQKTNFHVTEAHTRWKNMTEASKQALFERWKIEDIEREK
jgi:hypothetical protein